MDNLSLLLDSMHTELKKHRLLRRLGSRYHKILGVGNLRTVSRMGFKWKLYYRELERHIIKKGCFEPHQLEYFFTQARSRHCDIFLDAGANIGLYSLFAARAKLFQEIHAFEPGPETFARLQWHLQENGFADIVCAHQKAVTDSCGEIGLVDDGSYAAKVTDLQTATTKVEGVTLDSLFDFSGKSLAVKMDVERHEIPALKGAQKLFANNNIFLQLEVFADSTDTINYLFAQGFRMIHYQNNDFYFERQAHQKS